MPTSPPPSTRSFAAKCSRTGPPFQIAQLSRFRLSTSAPASALERHSTPSTIPNRSCSHALRRICTRNPRHENTPRGIAFPALPTTRTNPTLSQPRATPTYHGSKVNPNPTRHKTLPQTPLPPPRSAECDLIAALATPRAAATDRRLQLARTRQRHSRRSGHPDTLAFSGSTALDRALEPTLRTRAHHFCPTTHDDVGIPSDTHTHVQSNPPLHTSTAKHPTLHPTHSPLNPAQRPAPWKRARLAFNPGPPQRATPASASS